MSKAGRNVIYQNSDQTIFSFLIRYRNIYTEYECPENTFMQIMHVDGS